MLFRKAETSTDSSDPRILEQQFKKHFYLFQTLEIFRNEYEYNSLYLNRINEEEIDLYIRNLRSTVKDRMFEYDEYCFRLLKEILFYFKEFKVKKISITYMLPVEINLREVNYEFLRVNLYISTKQNSDKHS